MVYKVDGNPQFDSRDWSMCWNILKLRHTTPPDLSKTHPGKETTVGNTIMIHLQKNPFFSIKLNNFICSHTKHIHS